MSSRALCTLTIRTTTPCVKWLDAKTRAQVDLSKPLRYVKPSLVDDPRRTAAPLGCDDEENDHLLETALTGKADYLVSEDRAVHDLP
jgi:hypothetical protein